MTTLHTEEARPGQGLFPAGSRQARAHTHTHTHTRDSAHTTRPHSQEGKFKKSVHAYFFNFQTGALGQVYEFFFYSKKSLTRLSIRSRSKAEKLVGSVFPITQIKRNRPLRGSLHMKRNKSEGSPQKLTLAGPQQPAASLPTRDSQPLTPRLSAPVLAGDAPFFRSLLNEWQSHTSGLSWVRPTSAAILKKLIQW